MAKNASYGINTSSVKSAVKQGGKMAGGRRRGPSAPGMVNGNPFAIKQGPKGGGKPGPMGKKGKC